MTREGLRRGDGWRESKNGFLLSKEGTEYVGPFRFGTGRGFTRGLERVTVFYPRVSCSPLLFPKFSMVPLKKPDFQSNSQISKHSFQGHHPGVVGHTPLNYFFLIFFSDKTNLFFSSSWTVLSTDSWIWVTWTVLSTDSWFWVIFRVFPAILGLIQYQGRGMKDHVDKSIGIVTLIVEVLDKINPTDPLRFGKRAVRRKRNWSDSSGKSPVKILVSRCTFKKIR